MMDSLLVHVHMYCSVRLLIPRDENGCCVACSQNLYCFPDGFTLEFHDCKLTPRRAQRNAASGLCIAVNYPKKIKNKNEKKKLLWNLPTWLLME